MAIFDPRKGPYALQQPANWSCPRTAPYEPILAIPIEVRQIDPDWADCVGGINGVYDPPIALTPAEAIAKPTLPGTASETTSDAVPASTPRPTLATFTSTFGSDEVSAQPSTSKVQRPRPDDPGIGGSSTLAQGNGDQTERQGSSHEHHTTTSIKNVPPTENFGDTGNSPVESSVLGEPVSEPNSPDDRSRSQATNPAPKAQTDALSVLLEAQTSINASMRRQGSAEKTQTPSLPVTRIQPAETFESASDGMRLSAPPGSEVVPGSHALGAAYDSGANIIDHPVTDSSNVRSHALATVVAGDDAITAYTQDSAVVLAEGTHNLTVQSDSAVIIASRTIDFADYGHALILGSSTVDIPSYTDLDGDVSAAMRIY